MNQVQKRASVAPATVTDISKGRHQGIAKRTEAKRNHPAGTGKLRVIKPDIRVWKVAMRLAKNNPRLLEVRSTSEVIVHHNENWRTR